jgi:hypothetical protein
MLPYHTLKGPAFRLAMKAAGRASLPVLVAMLIALVLLDLVASAQARNYFISASGPLGDGSGSSPENAADASTPDRYYAINQAQHAPGTVIVYAPGIYWHETLFAMWDNVTHRGAGIDKTVIRVIDDAPNYHEMWAPDAGAPRISGFKFFDATIDFNASNQTWWKGTQGSTPSAFTFSLADHCTIQRVKFINMGSKGQESFPIYFTNGQSAAGNVNHNVIDSCIFTQPIRTGNTNGGLTCICIADAQPNITVDTTNIVYNCQFLYLNYPNYSDLSYAQCVSVPVARNNYADGVDQLWGYEPGSQSMGNNSLFPGMTCQVTGNTVRNGQLGSLLMHNNGTFGNLNLANNSVTMTDNTYKQYGLRPPIGFLIHTTGPAGDPAIGSIMINNNTFVALVPEDRSPSAVVINPVRPNLYHLASLTIKDNRFVNFPQDGNELQVNRAQVGTFTNVGNTFGAAPASTEKDTRNGTALPATEPTPTPREVRRALPFEVRNASSVASPKVRGALPVEPEVRRELPLGSQ